MCCVMVSSTMLSMLDVPLHFYLLLYLIINDVIRFLESMIHLTQNMSVEDGTSHTVHYPL